MWMIVTMWYVHVRRWRWTHTIPPRTNTMYHTTRRMTGTYYLTQWIQDIMTDPLFRVVSPLDRISNEIG
jgi:hypothetical protein